MLNDRDLAGLTTRLQVPQIVQDVLGGEAVSDDLRYGLHEVLSDQQPDSALLSIALGAHKIAVRYSRVNPTLAVLKMEAERVIADYAELWLKNARSARVNEADILDRLAYVPEDLQAMSELLEAASAFMQDADESAAELCRILMVQADAQGLIAEAFAEVLEIDEPDAQPAANDLLEDEAFNQEEYKVLGMEPAIYAADNVIAFPGGGVRA